MAWEEHGEAGKVEGQERCSLALLLQNSAPLEQQPKLRAINQLSQQHTTEQDRCYQQNKHLDVEGKLHNAQTTISKY